MATLITASSLYTTTFQTTENPLAESGRWTGDSSVSVDWTSMRVSSGECYGTRAGGAAPPYDDSAALATGYWGRDHRVEATVFTRNQSGTAFEEVEARLRSHISAKWNSGYEVNWRCTADGSQYAEVIRWNGPLNDFTQLAHKVAADGIPGVQNGHRVAAQIVGDTITVEQDTGGGFTTLYTYDISTNTAPSTSLRPTAKYDVGSPGIAHWFRQNGAAGTSSSDFGFTACTVKRL